MKRTPLLRRTPLRATKRIPPYSSKRRAASREYMRERFAYLEEFPYCQIRRPECTGRATEIHHRLSRARGGDLVDRANFVSACSSCHSYVTEHPRWAAEHGWLTRRVA